jgi:hypothetical protein
MSSPRRLPQYKSLRIFSWTTSPIQCLSDSCSPQLHYLPEKKPSEKSFRTQDFKSLGHASTSVLESRPLSTMKERAPTRTRLFLPGFFCEAGSLSLKAHQSAPPNEASYVSISFAGMPAARRLSPERQPPFRGHLHLRIQGLCQ